MKERVSIPTVLLESFHLIDQSITADAGVWRPTSSGHQASGLPIPLAALFFLCVLFCNAGPDLAARRPVNIRRREQKKRRNAGASIALFNVQLLHVGLRPAAGRASPLQVWRPWKHHREEGGKEAASGAGGCRLQMQGDVAVVCRHRATVGGLIVTGLYRIHLSLTQCQQSTSSSRGEKEQSNLFEVGKITHCIKFSIFDFHLS